MPSAYAHLRFGREVLSALPPKYRAAAKAMNQLYTVGLQGPDPLFSITRWLPTALPTRGTLSMPNPVPPFLRKL